MFRCILLLSEKSFNKASFFLFLGKGIGINFFPVLGKSIGVDFFLFLGKSICIDFFRFF